MLKPLLKFTLLLILFSTLISAQPPKHEFRAVWIASVTNIDWPSSKTLSPSQQRAEYISILDKHKLNGINAVVVQIRPSCDAFYDSNIEPWSEWLNGMQGQAPNPFYDPLSFMISEAHKRGMEFHAWFNPYRAVVNKNTSSITANHISVRQPSWVFTYGNLKMLDPGLPQVRNYVTSVIMDVVRRYDIDGVHFDDYFYPYPQSGISIPDSATFANHNRGFTNKNDWRRDNINLLIKMVNDSIKSVKPWVKFGISPFGIWRNQSTDPGGSATSGLQSYDEIFADSKKWVQSGWIDYIAPQVYWSFGYSAAKYEVLVPWWAANSSAMQRHLYIGQAAYRINPSGSDTAWKNLTQMPRQIRFNRSISQVKGSIFFSSKSITNNLGGFQDSLRRDFYKYPAIIPPMKWIDSIPAEPPVSPTMQVNGQQVTLQWTHPFPASDNNLPYFYVIYRYKTGETFNSNSPVFIRAIISGDSTKFTETVSSSVDSFHYAISSLDRLRNESAVIGVSLTDITDGKSIPTEFSLMQNYPNPFNPSTTIEYSVPVRSKVTIRVFDILGNEISLLVDAEHSPGSYKVNFNASGIPNGVYFYTMSTKEFTATKKLIILK